MTGLTAIYDYSTNIDLFYFVLEVLDFFLESGYLLSRQPAEVVQHVHVALLLSGVACLSCLDPLSSEPSLFVPQAVVERFEFRKSHRLLFFLALIVGHGEVDLLLFSFFDCRSNAILAGLARGNFNLVSLGDDPGACVGKGSGYGCKFGVDALALFVDRVCFFVSSLFFSLVLVIEFLILGGADDFLFRPSLLL